jgi:uncharacterized protein (UPF0216 family)
MRTELARMNAGIVVERKSLARLRAEEHPSAKTKNGSIHVFDRQVLERLAQALPAAVQQNLLLPILFHADMDVPGNLALTDPVALCALQELGELSSLRTMREGRIWIASPIAYALTRKYPTAIQVVMG